MATLFINKARTCALSGHRILDSSFNQERVKEIFIKLIEGGFNTFLVGMALGFDTKAFNILEELREKQDIKIIACIPCVSQADRFNLEQKKEYDRMLESADQKVYVSENYTKYCMIKRNKFMVDNSSCLVAYCKRDFGGTASTVKYAVKNNVPIIYID